MVFSFLFLTNCSIISTSEEQKRLSKQLEAYEKVSQKDYALHFKSLEQSILNGYEKKLIRISKWDERYLRELANHIMDKNELFFTKKNPVSFTFIQDRRPFHFSLPGRSLFFSSGLLGKYIKNPPLLVSLLTFELIRSEKLLYPPFAFIPTGYVEIDQLLSAFRLPLDVKNRMHQWSYHCLRRSDHDAEIYLSWLQVQNRNTLDFLMQLGDTGSISREETAFKTFLVGAKQVSKRRTQDYSKSFYRFINRFKPGRYE